MTTPEPANQPAATPPAAAAPPAPPAPEPAAEPAKAKTTDWQAEARKWEQRAKENKTAADELATLKQAQMSETERLTAQLTTAQKNAEAATAEALRWRVATKHGISDEDAETFLTGTDEESLTRQAERLASLAKQQATSPAGPRPDLSQGGTGGSTQGGPEKDFEAFLKSSLRQ